MICIDDVTPTINNPQYSHGWCIPSANGRLMALGLITILDDIDIYIYILIRYIFCAIKRRKQYQTILYATSLLYHIVARQWVVRSGMADRCRYEGTWPIVEGTVSKLVMQQK